MCPIFCHKRELAGARLRRLFWNGALNQPWGPANLICPRVLFSPAGWMLGAVHRITSGSDSRPSAVLVVNARRLQHVRFLGAGKSDVRDRCKPFRLLLPLQW